MHQTSTAFAVLAFCYGIASAQTAVWPSNLPDAGVLMRQSEQMMRQSQQLRQAHRVQSLPSVMVWSESTVVNVQTFKFAGNKLLSTEHLERVAAPFANRSLAERDGQHLTEVIVQAYRAMGWLVQVYIPRQDFAGNEMTIQILENVVSGAPR